MGQYRDGIRRKEDEEKRWQKGREKRERCKNKEK
jgi:hypothetical protein